MQRKGSDRLIPIELHPMKYSDTVDLKPYNGSAPSLSPSQIGSKNASSYAMSDLSGGVSGDDIRAILKDQELLETAEVNGSAIDGRDSTTRANIKGDASDHSSFSFSRAYHVQKVHNITGSQDEEISFEEEPSTNEISDVIKEIDTSDSGLTNALQFDSTTYFIPPCDSLIETSRVMPQGSQEKTLAPRRYASQLKQSNSIQISREMPQGSQEITLSTRRHASLLAQRNSNNDEHCTGVGMDNVVDIAKQRLSSIDHSSKKMSPRGERGHRNRSSEKKSSQGDIDALMDMAMSRLSRSDHSLKKHSPPRKLDSMNRLTNSEHSSQLQQVSWQDSLNPLSSSDHLPKMQSPRGVDQQISSRISTSDHSSKMHSLRGICSVKDHSSKDSPREILVSSNHSQTTKGGQVQVQVQVDPPDDVVILPTRRLGNAELVNSDYFTADASSDYFTAEESPLISRLPTPKRANIRKVNLQFKGDKYSETYGIDSTESSDASHTEEVQMFVSGSIQESLYIPGTNADDPGNNRTQFLQDDDVDDDLSAELGDKYTVLGGQVCEPKRTKGPKARASALRSLKGSQTGYNYSKHTESRVGFKLNQESQPVATNTFIDVCTAITSPSRFWTIDGSTSVQKPEDNKTLLCCSSDPVQPARWQESDIILHRNSPRNIPPPIAFTFPLHQTTRSNLQQNENALADDITIGSDSVQSGEGMVVIEKNENNSKSTLLDSIQSNVKATVEVTPIRESPESAIHTTRAGDDIKVRQSDSSNAILLAAKEVCKEDTSFRNKSARKSTIVEPMMTNQNKDDMSREETLVLCGVFDTLIQPGDCGPTAEIKVDKLQQSQDGAFCPKSGDIVPAMHDIATTDTFLLNRNDSFWSTLSTIASTADAKLKMKLKVSSQEKNLSIPGEVVMDGRGDDNVKRFLCFDRSQDNRIESALSPTSGTVDSVSPSELSTESSMPSIPQMIDLSSTNSLPSQDQANQKGPFPPSGSDMNEIVESMHKLETLLSEESSPESSVSSESPRGKQDKVQDREQAVILLGDYTYEQENTILDDCVESRKSTVHETETMSFLERLREEQEKHTFNDRVENQEDTALVEEAEGEQNSMTFNVWIEDKENDVLIEEAKEKDSSSLNDFPEIQEDDTTFDDWTEEEEDCTLNENAAVHDDTTLSEWIEERDSTGEVAESISLLEHPTLPRQGLKYDFASLSSTSMFSHESGFAELGEIVGAKISDSNASNSLNKFGAITETTIEKEPRWPPQYDGDTGDMPLSAPTMFSHESASVGSRGRSTTQAAAGNLSNSMSEVGKRDNQGRLDRYLGETIPKRVVAPLSDQLLKEAPKLGDVGMILSDVTSDFSRLMRSVTRSDVWVPISAESSAIGDTVTAASKISDSYARRITGKKLPLSTEENAHQASLATDTSSRKMAASVEDNSTISSVPYQMAPLNAQHKQSVPSEEKETENKFLDPIIDSSTANSHTHQVEDRDSNVDYPVDSDMDDGLWKYDSIVQQLLNQNRKLKQATATKGVSTRVDSTEIRAKVIDSRAQTLQHVNKISSAKLCTSSTKYRVSPCPECPSKWASPKKGMSSLIEVRKEPLFTKQRITIPVELETRRASSPKRGLRRARPNPEACPRAITTNTNSYGYRGVHSRPRGSTQPRDLGKKISPERKRSPIKNRTGKRTPEMIRRQARMNVLARSEERNTSPTRRQAANLLKDTRIMPPRAQSRYHTYEHRARAKSPEDLSPYTNRARSLCQELDVARVTCNGIRRSHASLSVELQEFKRKLNVHSRSRRNERTIHAANQELLKDFNERMNHHEYTTTRHASGPCERVHEEWGYCDDVQHQMLHNLGVLKKSVLKDHSRQRRLEHHFDVNNEHQTKPILQQCCKSVDDSDAKILKIERTLENLCRKESRNSDELINCIEEAKHLLHQAKSSDW